MSGVNKVNLRMATDSRLPFIPTLQAGCDLRSNIAPAVQRIASKIRIIGVVREFFCPCDAIVIPGICLRAGIQRIEVSSGLSAEFRLVAIQAEAITRKINYSRRLIPVNAPSFSIPPPTPKTIPAARAQRLQLPTTFGSPFNAMP